MKNINHQIVRKIHYGPLRTPTPTRYTWTRVRQRLTRRGLVIVSEDSSSIIKMPFCLILFYCFWEIQPRIPNEPTNTQMSARRRRTPFSNRVVGPFSVTTKTPTPPVRQRDIALTNTMKSKQIQIYEREWDTLKIRERSRVPLQLLLRLRLQPKDRCDRVCIVVRRPVSVVHSAARLAFPWKWKWVIFSILLLN